MVQNHSHRLSAAGAFVVALLWCCLLVGPGVATAQIPQASPVTDAPIPTATSPLVLNDPTPTATSPLELDELTPTPGTPTATDDAFQAAFINNFYFATDNITGYTLVSGQSLSTTFTISLNGQTSRESVTLLSDDPAITIHDLSPTITGSMDCTTSPLPNQSPITINFSKGDAGTATCVVTFTLSVNSTAPTGHVGDIWALFSSRDLKTNAPVYIVASAESEFSAVFSPVTYGAPVGGSGVELTFIITVGAHTDGSYVIVLPTEYKDVTAFSNPVASSSDDSLNCSAIIGTSGVIEGSAFGEFNNNADTAHTCTITVNYDDTGTITPGTQIMIVTSFDPAKTPVPYALVTFTSATQAALPTIGLSDTAPLPGDPVTVTAIQVDPSTISTLATISSTLPAGVTYVPDSAAITCVPECATIPTASESAGTVTGSYHPSVNSPAVPTTVTLTYQVTINNEGVTPGTVAVFNASAVTASGSQGPVTANATIGTPLTPVGLTAATIPGGIVTLDLNDGVTGGIPTYTFSVDGLPAEGNASITGSTLTYTADDDAPLGDDAFTVQVLDSGVTQHTASIPVTITIAAEPLPLTAGTVTITANPGETVNGDLRTSVSGGVPPYTFGLGDQGSQGTATVNEDGTFTYTANDGATGTDSFTYTETDSEQVLTTIDAAATTTGTVNVTIIAPDATATVTPTVTPIVTPTTDPTATPSPTSSTGTSTSTGTVLPGRPGSNATQTPASDDDADGNGSGNKGVTQLPNTGTGANDDSSLALLGLAGAVALLLASLVAYRRQQA